MKRLKNLHFRQPDKTATTTIAAAVPVIDAAHHLRIVAAAEKIDTIRR